MDEIKTILAEIRDNQKASLEKQSQHLAIAERQLERANTQVEESLKLQREAIAKQRSIARIAFPAILLCIALILYIFIRYF